MPGLTEALLHEHEPETDPDPRAVPPEQCPRYHAETRCPGTLTSRLRRVGDCGEVFEWVCGCCDYVRVLL